MMHHQSFNFCPEAIFKNHLILRNTSRGFAPVLFFLVFCYQNKIKPQRNEASRASEKNSKFKEMLLLPFLVSCGIFQDLTQEEQSKNKTKDQRPYTRDPKTQTTGSEIPGPGRQDSEIKEQVTYRFSYAMHRKYYQFISLWHKKLWYMFTNMTN